MDNSMTPNNKSCANAKNAEEAILKAIANVEAEYTIWRKNPSMRNLWNIEDMVIDLLDRKTDGHTMELRIAVGKTILKYGDATYENKCLLGLSTSNAIIRHMAKTNITDMCRADTGLHNAITWLVLDHATTYSAQNNEDYADYYKKLLGQLTNVIFPAEKTSTLDKVVTHLYGPAVWDLYGTDLSQQLRPEELATLIHTIVGLNLPPYLGRQAAKNAASTDPSSQPTQGSLPHDL